MHSCADYSGTIGGFTASRGAGNGARGADCDGALPALSDAKDRFKLEHDLFRALRRETGGPDDRRIVLKRMLWMSVVDPLWHRDGYDSPEAWFQQHATVYGLTAYYDRVLDCFTIGQKV